MVRTDAIVIGGGQAGLAMSRCLTDRDIDHVVLERGRVGERWRTERWDSLRLLTPRWQSRLPGFRYEGPDPDGYMTMPEVIDYFEHYARSFEAPVHEETTVRSVERAGDGYRLVTDRGAFESRSVVIATGACGTPRIPGIASSLSPDVLQLVPTRYRNPDQLPAGGVLVVGASASGVQLADEIRASGRRVILSVGRHTRLPRTYRGRDILWWLDRMGIFDERAEDVFDVDASRAQPSLQLVGRPDQASLDLAVLQSRGVELAGRAVAAEGTRITFADDLSASTGLADAKLAQLLARVDAFIDSQGAAGEATAPDVIAPVEAGPSPNGIDVAAEGIETVLWATGFRPSYPWLNVPVLDECGEVRHAGGVTPSPGLYVIGLRFLRRRKSNFIDGVGDDARELTDHLAARLDGSSAAA